MQGLIILITGFVVLVALVAIWLLARNASKFHIKLNEIKDNAEKANKKDELRKVYNELMEASKYVWHYSLELRVMEIKTYIITKLEYMDEKPIDILSVRQIQNVLNYYDEHTDFVEKIIKETNKAYPPSEGEDKNNPSIWKPGHWNWFLLFNC